MVNESPGKPVWACRANFIVANTETVDFKCITIFEAGMHPFASGPEHIPQVGRVAGEMPVELDHIAVIDPLFEHAHLMPVGIPIDVDGMPDVKIRGGFDEQRGKQRRPERQFEQAGNGPAEEDKCNGYQCFKEEYGPNEVCEKLPSVNCNGQEQIA
jgi:hypothetical protein